MSKQQLRDKINKHKSELTWLGKASSLPETNLYFDTSCVKGLLAGLVCQAGKSQVCRKRWQDFIHVGRQIAAACATRR